MQADIFCSEHNYTKYLRYHKDGYIRICPIIASIYHCTTNLTNK